MFDPENFKQSLFFIQPSQFEGAALQLFEYQWQNNPIYRTYCTTLGKDPSNVHSVESIPFLPIAFFKTQEIKTGAWITEKIFKSSGTTGAQRSCHHVGSETFYHQIAEKAFEMQYGQLAEFEVLALLPSYLEQGDSSLISMVDYFISRSSPSSAFLLDDEKALFDKLTTQSAHRKLIIGVTYALLDLASNLPIDLSEAVIMETGGMKGRRKEMIRSEVHAELKQAFSVSEVHSEYGMTELTSQAYGVDGRFQMPPWCKVSIRDINDPFTLLKEDQTGGINVIDLANTHSCAFIETKDLGKVQLNGEFEVLGRFDNSDLRGCNLLL